MIVINLKNTSVNYQKNYLYASTCHDNKQNIVILHISQQ